MAKPQGQINGALNSLESMGSFVAKNFDELFTRLEFTPNDQGRAGNFDAQIVSITGTVVEFAVKHRLERVPTGYIPIAKSQATRLFDGDTEWTDDTIYLKSTIDNVAMKILII